MNRRKRNVVLWSLIGLIAYQSQSQDKVKPEVRSIPVQALETVQPLSPYDRLTYDQVEQIQAEAGTKSVLFNQDRSKIYAMNLEGMSVAAYDRITKRPDHFFRFERTKGRGWDYTTNRSIASWEEKPVEAWLTHQDRLLWVSLHNAGGIVGIRVDSLSKNILTAGPLKRIQAIDAAGKATPITVPFITTGATPKIIIATPDDKKLLVSNWHSKTISVLDLDINTPPYAKLMTDIRVPDIPRGMVSDPRRKKTYVALMGGSSLAVIDEKTWKLDTLLPIGGSPRHILQDTNGRLLVSYNAQAKLACLDPDTGKTLFTISTAAQPRTIALSKNQRFVFATGYSSNRLEVYKIYADRFERVASLPCPGHPVGVDLYEDNDKIEAWVCSYLGGNIHIFSFKKAAASISK